MNATALMGFKNKKDFDFLQSVFIFMKELGVNPLPEEYEVTPTYALASNRIVKLIVKKKAMDIQMFSGLLNEIKKHYEKESKAMKKGRKW